MILYIFPEAGLVLFMSLYQWVGNAYCRNRPLWWILFTSQRSRFVLFLQPCWWLYVKHSQFEYFLQSNRTYGVVELSLWLVRVLSNVRSWCLYLEMMKWQHFVILYVTASIFLICIFQLTGLVCVHSLWTVWREEKSLFRSLHQLGIVSWMIMIMVRDAFYWWSRRWWRWCTAMGNWEADKAQLACCGSVKRKLPWPEPMRIEKEASTNRNENPGI